jgi:hypothetical protein
MSDQEEVKSSPNRIKLWIVFVSVYSLGLLGALASEWESAGVAKQWTSGFGTFDQLANLSNQIFTLAGFIDIFLFPALASSITITTAVLLYRKFAVRLKKSSLKPLLAIVFVISTILVWILLSALLAVLVLL